MHAIAADRTIGVGLIVQDGLRHRETEPNGAALAYRTAWLLLVFLRGRVSSVPALLPIPRWPVSGFLQVDPMNLQLVSAWSVALMLSR